MRDKYLSFCTHITIATKTPIVDSAVEELKSGIESMLDSPVTTQSSADQSSSIVLATNKDKLVDDYEITWSIFEEINEEGYLLKTATNLKNNTNDLLIIGKTDRGILYGAFLLLRLMQTMDPLENLHITDQPRNQLRMINQWDNMDGSIERGYSGQSIFFANHD